MELQVDRCAPIPTHPPVTIDKWQAGDWLEHVNTLKPNWKEYRVMIGKTPICGVVRGSN